MGNKGYIIGLDIGINNVGWSILDSKCNDIIDYGVVLFKESSNAQNRRQARAIRRLKKRRLHRIERLGKLFYQYNISPKRSIDDKLLDKRVKGLNEKLEIQDIVNIVYYMGAHRGYIPFNEDNEERETVALKKEEYPCQYLQKTLCSKGKYRNSSLAIKHEDNIKELFKILYTQKKFYIQINDELINKIIEIISSKRKFFEGPGGIKENQLTPYGRFTTIDDINKLSDDKNYNKYLYEKLIGKCKIVINEPCAPTGNFHVEEFNFYNDFINMKVINPSNIQEQYQSKITKKGSLTAETINEIKEYILNKKSVSFESIFNNILNTNLSNIEGFRVNKEFKPEISKFETYKYILEKFKKAGLTPEWLTSNNKSIYNKVIYVLTVVPSSDLIEEILKDRISEYNFNKNEVIILKDIKQKKNNDLKYHSLSESIIKRAINDMEINSFQKNYMRLMKEYDYEKEAREFFQTNYTNQTNEPYLMENKFIDSLIANPQVKKTLRKAIKVINAITLKMEEYPSVIAIESTKELNGRQRRNELIDEQRKNEKRREEAKHYLETNNLTINETNIIKVMCYLETNGHCIYCNKPISEKLILTLELEHILPISKSYDNSFNNLTISCLTCNKDKDNRTPYEYLLTKNCFDEFKERVLKYKLSQQKINNLIYQGNVDKSELKFLNRNLRDTAYGSVALVDEINKYNQFLGYKLDGTNKTIKVVTIPGQITSKIRTNLNMDPKDRTSKFHHAVDASIVASVANSEIGEILIKSQNEPKFWIENKKIYPKVVYLLKNLKIDNCKIIKNIDNNNTKYSYEVNRNPQKEIANSNVVKVFNYQGVDYKVANVNNIYNLDLKKSENIKLFEKLIDEKQTDKILMCELNDISLFDLIKNVYWKYKSTKANPFVAYCCEIHGLDKTSDFDYLIHGIRKPSKKENAPIVKRLRYLEKINFPYYIEKSKSTTKINTHQTFVSPNKSKSKIALDSVAQYRTDIYYDKQNLQFVFLPIYVVSVNLKTKEINEDERYYKAIKEKYIGDKEVIFIGSIYNGEWIRVTKRKPINLQANLKEVINPYTPVGKYKGWHKTHNKIDFYLNGDMNLTPMSFTKNDLRIEIFTMDILGKLYKRLDSKDLI